MPKVLVSLSVSAFTSVPVIQARSFARRDVAQTTRKSKTGDASYVLRNVRVCVARPCPALEASAAVSGIVHLAAGLTVHWRPVP